MPNWTEELEKDLEWREAELVNLKILVKGVDEGSVRQKALLRALWAILYAHYEGFCKFALRTYLDALAQLKPRRADCKAPITALSMFKKFKGLAGKLSRDNCILFLQQFPLDLNEPVEFDDESFENLFAKQSNLFPDLLCKNCQWVALPYGEVEDNKRYLEALVARRNDIAHGKNTPVRNFDEYKKHEDAALTVMHALAVAIIDALEQKQYLK